MSYMIVLPRNIRPVADWMAAYLNGFMDGNCAVIKSDVTGQGLRRLALRLVVGERSSEDDEGTHSANGSEGGDALY